ncbi:MAG TPA: hypothetical protein PLL69_01445 [Gemmatimonadales bacterium]|nr:hypothetical protein [Gemmatimonadales bacterium]
MDGRTVLDLAEGLQLRRVRVMGAHRIELRATVFQLRVALGDSQRAIQPNRIGSLRLHPGDLIESALIQLHCLVASHGADRVVVEVGGACQEETTVAARGTARHLAGIDADHPLAKAEQFVDGGEARTAESDHADVTSDVAPQRRKSGPRGVIPYRSGAQFIPTRPLVEAISGSGLYPTPSLKT